MASLHDGDALEIKRGSKIQEKEEKKEYVVITAKLKEELTTGGVIESKETYQCYLDVNRLSSESSCFNQACFQARKFIKEKSGLHFSSRAKLTVSFYLPPMKFRCNCEKG